MKIRNKKKIKVGKVDKVNRTNLIDSIRFSIRITSKSVTSVSLKKNICSLWLLLSEVSSNKNREYKYIVSNFIYSSLNKWNKDTAKGFSDFITEEMIQEILEKDDFILYSKIKRSL